MNQNNMSSGNIAKIKLKTEYMARIAVWLLVAATVVTVQLFVPKVQTQTGQGAITWSLNGIFRGLFLISPWVGFICSAGGQLNVLPLVWANPLFLLSPAIYALLGLLFWRIHKKIGKGYVKDIALLMAFGIVQGVIVTFNSALTNTLSNWSLVPLQKKLSELTFNLVALRSVCNGLLYVASYPMTLFIRKVFGNKDPFKLPVFINKSKEAM